MESLDAPPREIPRLGRLLKEPVVGWFGSLDGAWLDKSPLRMPNIQAMALRPLRLQPSYQDRVLSPENSPRRAGQWNLLVFTTSLAVNGPRFRTTRRPCHPSNGHCSRTRADGKLAGPRMPTVGNVRVVRS